MTALLDNLALGFGVALSPQNLAYCFLGVFLGTFLGVLPGIGTMAAISLLFPLTFYLPPETALIMLAGIWYGTAYGGSTASILLNLPGTPANAVTCLDGYPMARNGRAGAALLFTTLASFVGATFSILLLMFLAPTLAGYATSFRSTDYFSLMVLGLVAASAISEGSFMKGIAMSLLGILIGLVGTDIYTGASRLTFGIPHLSDGIHIAVLAIGLFGVAEVMQSANRMVHGADRASDVSLQSLMPTPEENSKFAGPAWRGSLVGAFFGALPGTGPSVAAFVAYGIEKQVSRDRDRFGKGAVQGIVAPEAANSSADMAAFIPTLSLGVPGSATMALMLGALMIHGIIPGPNLIRDQPQLFWGLVASFWIGNLLLLVLNIPLIGLWVRLLLVPYRVLFPIVMVLIVFGAFSINNSVFDVVLVGVFGVLGVALRRHGFPLAPVLLGFVLGPLIEEHFRRALLVSRGDFLTFVDRPLSLAFLIAVALLILGKLGFALRRRLTARGRRRALP